jgi:FkbM family methyltransferase
MKPKNTFRSNGLVGFYRFWHGRLHLKGAGFLLRHCARFFRELEHYQLEVPGVGRLTVNLRDGSGMAWLNYSLGESGHEDGLISALKKLAPKNPVLWDIGANAGFFVAALVKNLGEYSEIRMFEPNPKLMPGLSELVGCLPQTHAHNLAFSDVPGNLVLHIPPGDSTTASLTPKPGSTPVAVECTTGDIFLQATGAADPDVIVIDTEGNDARVIMGLKELIKRKRPVIFFENLFLNETVVRAALPDNYKHFTVDDRTGELIDKLDSSRGHNSVFIPQ